MTHDNSSDQVLFLGAGAQMQCGVGHFTHLLRDAVERQAPGSTATLTLTRDEGDLRAIWRAIGRSRTVVVNFPIVAWKRVILRPLLAMLFARLRGRRVLLLQHEWGGLNRARRVTYLPAVLLANIIMMFSPLVRRELAADPLVGGLAKRCVIAPLPPNIEAPAQTADSPLRQRLAAARQKGRLVLGHFGSIYPGKQPQALLDIAAIMKQRGLNPLIVYVGSFIRGTDTVEEDFRARMQELNLVDDVVVTGFIASDAEVFGLFEQTDVFCYLLDEGLTARRASILTCIQAGRPLAVTAPASSDEFDHHPRFKELIARGAVVLVPRGASSEIYAEAVMSAARQGVQSMPFDFKAWWDDVARAVRARL